MVPNFVDGANVKLLNAAQIAQDSRLQWGVERVDLLLKTFFTRVFSKLDVVWGIEAEAQPNACVWGHVSPSVILMTSGALQYISDTRALLTTPAISFAKNYAFPMSTILVKEVEDSSQALAQAGENLGLFALAALFAHEVGHIYDRQSERPPSIKKKGVLGQAFEVTADTWAMRACCDLAIGWARDLTARTDMPLESALRAGLFYVMVGYGLIETIDWKEEWRLPSPSEKITHPPGALRMVSGAVSIAEWLVEREMLDEKTAASVAGEVFAVSAQTLFWFQTRKEVPPVTFQALTLFLFGNGSVIDTMRVEYERFRASLP